jgi:hypothetical protein
MEAHLRVGIVPASEHRARRRLWAALEEAYPVRFEGRGAGVARGLDAAVVLGVEDIDMGIPTLMLQGEETSGRPAKPLVLAADATLARPLRGAQLSDGCATALRSVDIDEVVLATLDGAPAWVNGRVACAPSELGAEEALRERLRPGRCLALLALAHFLVGLTAHLRPPTPPLSAALLIDDPNLHLSRYGHIDYAELGRHTREHGYHLAVAMVPLDARFAHPRAVRIFREGVGHLSLCIHGNDHDGPELGQPHSEAQATALVAQALRRSAAFARRTGVPVDRVMVPPHERLSEPVARALYACGFQALTTTRPYPWLADTLERSWLARPPEAGPLVGWRPFDVLAGGLPVLLRADFECHPREDLVLRAFLGQPLILYGHHDLLAGGPDALARAAAEINRLGGVRWCSLADMAPTPPPATPTMDAAALAAIPRPRRRLAPLLRRIASEGRDRAQPLSTHLLRTQPLRTQPLRTQPINPAQAPTAARAARPMSSSART